MTAADQVVRSVEKCLPLGAVHIPLSHGIARVDDRRIVSGIIFVIKNGLRWRDAPREYGPHKTIHL
jgi:transposase